MSDLLFTSDAAPGELLLGQRRRSRRSRAVGVLAAALIVAGALALLDAAVTVLWQEPFSALYAALKQDRLNGALRRVERAPPTAAERHALASISDERARIAFLAGELEHHTSEGGPVGRIVIPSIGASFVVVKGTNTEDLKSGPGIFSNTSFPGIGDTTSIAGHRTTYLAPFRHIDALATGSAIRLDMPYAQFIYTVIGHQVVAPTDVQAAVGDTGYTRLVLSACTPLFSAAKRLLVFARLQRTVPRGPARVLPGGAIAHSIPTAAAPARGKLPPVLEPVHPNLLPPLV